MRNKQKQIGTHDGAFHCDEALACWMLHQTLDFRDASITRTRLCLPSHTSRPFCLLPLSCAGVCGCCGDKRRAVVDSAFWLLSRALVVSASCCLCFLWPALTCWGPILRERVSLPLSFALVSCLCLLSHASVWCFSAHASFVSLSWRAARAYECLQRTAYK